MFIFDIVRTSVQFKSQVRIVCPPIHHQYTPHNFEDIPLFIPTDGP